MTERLCCEELKAVTNACRDPRVNLTHTLEQCVKEAYNKIEALHSIIRNWDNEDFDEQDCLSQLIAILGPEDHNVPTKTT